MQFINNQAEFEHYIKVILNSHIIAIDTEFVRENSYFPKLCLLQIATDEDNFIFDTLAIDNLSPLEKILYNPKIKKIFHSCKQDIEIFYNRFQKIPENIEDTQILCLAYGFQQQISYQKLAKAVLNVDIVKNAQISNWQKRPLSQKQIEYASNDVSYLLQIYHKLQLKLSKLKRLDWCETEMEQILDIDKIKIDTKNAYKKIKFKPKSVFEDVALKKIAQWREEKAILENCPRKNILSDQNIKILCQFLPTDKNELDDIRICGKFLKRQSFINHIIELIKEIKTSCEQNQKLYTTQKDELKLSKQKPRRISPLAIELAMILLKQIALNEKVNHKLLASNDEIKSFLQDQNDQFKFSSKWKEEILLAPLTQFRKGLIGLGHENGKISILDSQNLKINLNNKDCSL